MYLIRQEEVSLQHLYDYFSQPKNNVHRLLNPFISATRFVGSFYSITVSLVLSVFNEEMQVQLIQEHTDSHEFQSAFLFRFICRAGPKVTL